mgnify:CR=1 FL=1
MILSSLFISTAKAVELTDEDYARLNKVFSEARISVMTQEEVDKYLAMNLENAKSETTYYKGVSHGNESYTWYEISKDEYDNSDSEIQPHATYIATEYKEVKITAIEGFENVFSFDLTAKWKKMPAARSYDVIAFRFRNIALIEGTQFGLQSYIKSGSNSYDHISYTTKSGNMKKTSQGFGISMNLVDNSISALELEISAEGVPSGINPYVWGNYQHAVENVTLAQSQKYNITSAGYGNVINFDLSVEDHYDGMGGVYIAL